MGGVGIGDLAGEMGIVGFGAGEMLLSEEGVGDAGLGVALGLSAGGGGGFGDLALFASGGDLGEGGGFGSTGGFDAFGGGDAGGVVGLAEGAFAGLALVGAVVWVLVGALAKGIAVAGGGGCGCLFGGVGGGFGLGLSLELELADLLGVAMAELGAVFASGGGEVAVLGAMEVGPGIEDRDVVGGFDHRRFLGPVGIGVLCAHRRRVCFCAVSPLVAARPSYSG